jgi:tyrosyl-tRNA synthetase
MQNESSGTAKGVMANKTPEELKRVAAQLIAGCKDVVSEPDLVRKLEKAEAERKPLRAKLGIDASGPDIHLGFAVVLWKLRQFQEQGHTAVLVVGDFTGRIGDPSGRSKTRPQLSDEDIERNMARYKEQISKILIPDRTEFVFNSSWSDPLTAREIIKLASRITLARIIEREDFKNRLSQGLPVGLHEMLYPLFQAYDSVAVKADVELGGQDQYWNLLVGRELQRSFGQEPQVIMTMPLLEGLDGKLKMSKSYDNYIGVSEPPQQIYGKAMSIPDALIARYFELATDWSPERVREVEQGLKRGDNPRDWKDKLARAIVTRYHSRDDADSAAAEFSRMFKEHRPPEEMPELQLDGPAALVDVIVRAGLLPSKSEARRKIAEGAVYLDAERVADPGLTLEPGNPRVLKVGKRKFLRIR